MIKVKNTGTETLSDVIVKDSIPEHTTYINGSIDSTSDNTDMNDVDSTLRWKISSIKENETVTVSFRVKVNEMKENGKRSIKNIAQVQVGKEPEKPTNEVEHFVEYRSAASVMTGDEINTNIYLSIGLGSLFVSLRLLQKKKKNNKTSKATFKKIGMANVLFAMLLVGCGNKDELSLTCESDVQNSIIEIYGRDEKVRRIEVASTLEVDEHTFDKKEIETIVDLGNKEQGITMSFDVDKNLVHMKTKIKVDEASESTLKKVSYYQGNTKEIKKSIEGISSMNYTCK